MSPGTPLGQRRSHWAPPIRAGRASRLARSGRAVPDVFAFDEIKHPLTDIRGMVGNALQGLRGENQTNARVTMSEPVALCQGDDERSRRSSDRPDHPARLRPVLCRYPHAQKPVAHREPSATSSPTSRTTRGALSAGDSTRANRRSLATGEYTVTSRIASPSISTWKRSSLGSLLRLPDGGSLSIDADCLPRCRRSLRQWGLIRDSGASWSFGRWSGTT